MNIRIFATALHSEGNIIAKAFTQPPLSGLIFRAQRCLGLLLLEGELKMSFFLFQVQLIEARVQY